VGKQDGAPPAPPATPPTMEQPPTEAHMPQFTVAQRQGELRGETPVVSSPPVLVSPPPPAPEALIQELTRDQQESPRFPVRSVIVSMGFDAAWLRTNEILAKNKDKVIEADKETGLVVTDLSSHGFFKRYDRYYIVVERATENTTRVVLKVLSYDKDYKNVRDGTPLPLVPAGDNVIEKLIARFFDQFKK
jgi:hypothetical protein